MRKTTASIRYKCVQVILNISCLQKYKQRYFWKALFIEILKFELVKNDFKLFVKDRDRNSYDEMGKKIN